MMSRTNASVALLVCGLLLAMATACGDQDQMRSSVVLCESAADHIKKCCGAAPPELSCKYTYDAPGIYCDPDCKGSEVQPDFSEAASQCILAKGCVEITGVSACSAVPDTVRVGDRIAKALGCPQ